MKQSAQHGVRSLLSPAGLVAMLALVVALSGTAWAAATITGRDIKNGTVTTRDIKNHNLRLKDMNAGVKRAIRNSGARAVAVFGGGSGVCNIDSTGSRGFAGCTHPSQGEYTLTLKGNVNYKHTAPICALEYAGGFNSTNDFSCEAVNNQDGTITVSLSLHNDTTTGSRIHTDAQHMVLILG